MLYLTFPCLRPLITHFSKTLWFLLFLGEWYLEIKIWAIILFFANMGYNSHIFLDYLSHLPIVSFAGTMLFDYAGLC